VILLKDSFHTVMRKGFIIIDCPRPVIHIERYRKGNVNTIIRGAIRNIYK